MLIGGKKPPGAAFGHATRIDAGAPRLWKARTCQPWRGVLEFRPRDASHESDLCVRLRFHLSPAAGRGNRLGRTQPIPKKPPAPEGLAVFFLDFLKTAGAHDDYARQLPGSG